MTTMMRIDFATIFPECVTPYIDCAMMQRAQDAGAVTFGVHNIRDFSRDPHKRVDDTPYGGGAGMVMAVEPIYRTVEHITQKTPDIQNRRIILLSAKGTPYTQRTAKRLASSYEQLILICGRYEGVDERVALHIADEEIAIGEYVLTGGELGAMVIADSVVRLLPGVLGNDESIVHESHATDGYREHPQYTKPEEFHGWRVPEVLLSGHHQKIAQWRTQHSTGTPEQ
ncbi:MAG: tRNA (guanosine(37)-N1)-methyltransferase TrmD [Candidatus Moraniibacteriota bacterium]|nr:MAG: tRNA (guanosine(37)-N1)-methyltransferase TrmD [Candidatus Moranbacteria bacterium]